MFGFPFFVGFDGEFGDSHGFEVASHGGASAGFVEDPRAVHGAEGGRGGAVVVRVHHDEGGGDGDCVMGCYFEVIRLSVDIIASLMVFPFSYQAPVSDFNSN